MQVQLIKGKYNNYPYPYVDVQPVGTHFFVELFRRNSVLCVHRNGISDADVFINTSRVIKLYYFWMRIKGVDIFEKVF